MSRPMTMVSVRALASDLRSSAARGAACGAGAARWHWSRSPPLPGTRFPCRPAWRACAGSRAPARHARGSGLDADLARFDYLPALLEMTPDRAGAAGAPADAALRDTVNRYLDGVNATAGAEMLYVLDTGRHLAGRIGLGPTGHDHRAGPVFPALRDRCAGVRAAGASTGWASPASGPGYYLSYALRRGQSRAAWWRSRSTSRRPSARGASCRATWR